MSSTRVHQPIRTYTHNLSDRKAGTAEYPYGWYKYESSKTHLPGGLFHFIKDADLYVPTLHGIRNDSIKNLKGVAVSTESSAIANRPFLNAPHLFEVELINTGQESLKQGDRFTVQLPNREDVAAQQESGVDLGYHVNNGILGGLLATRRVNCEAGGDPVEEVIQAIAREDEFDVLQLISPYTPHSILSMMTLVANGADYHNVTNALRANAAAVVNEDFNADALRPIVEDVNVKKFLRTVLRHAMAIVESVQGFAGGQVVRACNGCNISTIKTGDRFKAQLNVNRWLL